MNRNIPYNLNYVRLISIVAAIGGFLFGYDWVVVGGAKPFYEPYFGLETPGQQGWGTSSALVGCILGALACMYMADKFGRKRLLILAGFLFAISAIGTAMSSDFSAYNSYRILGGLGIGIVLNLSPMYIAEMSPPHLRGKFVSLNQLMIMIGILSAQLVNWQISEMDTNLMPNATEEMIRQSWSGQMGWRWMFGVEFIPAFLFFLLMWMIPESVKWLLKKGENEKAAEILNKIGGEDYARLEIAEVTAVLKSETVKTSYWKELTQSNMLKILMLGIFLAILQQWSGMNVVFYYAADIFQAAGYDIKQMMLQIAVIGTVMVISVIFTIYLVDSLGRKTLMLFGTGALAVIYIIEGFCFYYGVSGIPIVVLTLLSVAVYSFTLAPLLWVILSEIYPTHLRGAAMSIAATAHWIGNFSLTFTFPTIKENLGWPANFWLYAGICTIGFIILILILPETKGKSLEEIQQEFGV
ncbi:sugar porter family MFS transporter [Membranihabitans maritimus]|uniref:sugar porter family MFS transporter n=1 Tax=Membranihabitans maritimus TaxID=2904244 RepID=UPI001F013824|nr:sugar porter family MFS transporter [Membranihabitans maritimus]